jgi:hypothetical protein
MYGQHHPGYPYPPYAPAYNPGLVDLFGSMIGLATATIYGGARVIRTIVEGSVWCSHHDCYGDCGGCDPCCHPMHHCYDVECLPHTYHCDCG